MSVINELKKLGRDQQSRNKAKEIFKLQPDKILEEFPMRVIMKDGAATLDCLLNCAPSTSTTVCYQSKIIEIVLSKLRTSNVGLKLCSELICRVCMVLPRIPKATVSLADQALHSIIHDEDINMVWRDILPECLSVLADVGTIVHCGSEMSAEEYKTQCVRTLCQCRWQDRCVVQLAAMFRDIELDREEHSQVVTKLCTVLLDLPPETIPPLLVQLLNLCSTQNTEIVFAYLSHYFNIKLYGKLKTTLQDSDSTVMDIEDFEGHTVAELRECVSTCLYHCLGVSEQLSRTLKMWPRSLLLHNPFLVEVALALADSPVYKTVSLAALKAAIQQNFQDEQKSREAMCVRPIIQNNVDITSLLKIIICDSSNPRHLTMVGLNRLAFSLLTTSPIMGRERLAHQNCVYAKLILVRLIKSQPETSQHILNLLSDQLQENSLSQRQCADCLQVLCKLTPNALQCAQLCSILENCQSFGEDYHSSAAVYEAVHPVLNFKSRVRDTLVMVCRKGLFSRHSSSRCLAVWGLLSLLRHIRLPAGGAGAGAGGDGAAGDSHSEPFSVNSCLTQISISLHQTLAGGSVVNIRNESLCREVVSVLRRCFGQDTAVKQLLYTNIYACTKQKPSLHTPILELLYEHLNRYISEENGLNFDKCVQMTPAGMATLIEPLGHLLLAIQHFLLSQPDEESEDMLATQEEEGLTTEYYRKKLRSRMETLCEKFSKFQLINFEMDGEHGLADLTPESRAKSIRIQQSLQVYEALMAYRVMQWTRQTEAPASKTYALFTVYNQLMEHAKTPSKIKKGNKTLNETTQKTQKTQNEWKGKEAKNKPLKLTSMVKERAPPFKPLPCLWDLATCCRVLDLLYGEHVAWSTDEQRATLRTRRDLHRLAFSALQSALADGHMSRTCLVAYCTRASTVLFNRCIARLNDVCDFNEQTALFCVDTFKDCLGVAFNLRNGFKLDKYLQTVTGNADGSVDSCLAAILEVVVTGLTTLDAEGAGEQDAVSRRLSLALLQLASFLLDKQQNNDSDEFAQVVNKLEQYIRASKGDSTSLIPALLAARARSTQDGRLLDDLIAKLTAVLGKIEEEEDSPPEPACADFPCVDGSTAGLVFGHACAHAAAHCAQLEYVLERAKPLYAAAKFATQQHAKDIDNELLVMEKTCVVQLCLAGARVARLCALCCPVGAGSDRALGAALRLYAALAALVGRLTKAGAARVHNIRLERALSVCGRPLSGVLDSLVTYVESSQGRGDRDKVLREMRVVPRVVFAAERFSKAVVLLGKRTKINLQQYLSLGTARDFRIKAGVLEEALRGQANGRGDAEEQGDMEVQGDAEERGDAEEPVGEDDITEILFDYEVIQSDESMEELNMNGSKRRKSDSD